MKDLKTVLISRLNFELSRQVARKTYSGTGHTIHVTSSLDGIEFQVFPDIDVRDFWYIKGYLQAIEQTMVDMFQ